MALYISTFIDYMTGRVMTSNDVLKKVKKPTYNIMTLSIRAMHKDAHTAYTAVTTKRKTGNGHSDEMHYRFAFLSCIFI
jgi:cobalamin biosynthesis Co2+ chelatase CbiK